MKKTKNQPETKLPPVLEKYGIRHTYPDGTSGWLIRDDLEVETYATVEETQKAIRAHKRDTRYTWPGVLEVVEYKGRK